MDLLTLVAHSYKPVSSSTPGQSHSRINSLLSPHISREEKESRSFSSSTRKNHHKEMYHYDEELCGPSDAVFKQRTSDPRTGSKMRGQLLWCLRISLRIAESPYKQLRNFAKVGTV